MSFLVCSKCWLLSVVLLLTNGKVYDVIIRTDDGGNAGTSDSIYIGIYGSWGRWSSHVEFPGVFSSKDTTYDLSQYSYWDVQDVGTAQLVRVTSFGTDGFQLREVIVDGVSVVKNYQSLANNEADGRCDRITIDIFDDSYEHESFDSSISCAISASPTLLPTKSPTNSPTQITNSPTKYPTAITNSPTLSPTAAPTITDAYLFNFELLIKLTGLSENDYLQIQYINTITTLQYTIENSYLEFTKNEYNYTNGDSIYVDIFRINDIRQDDFNEGSYDSITRRRVLLSNEWDLVKIYSTVWCAANDMCKELYDITFGKNSSFNTYLVQQLSNLFEGIPNTTISIKTDDKFKNDNSLPTSVIVIIVLFSVIVVIFIVFVIMYFYCKHQYGEGNYPNPCKKKNKYQNHNTNDTNNINNNNNMEMINSNNQPGNENKVTYQM